MKLHPLRMLLPALLTAACTGSHQPQPNAEADRQAIGQVIEQYVQTINRCDTALVNRIWSHSPEVSFIGPSGYYATHHEIRDSLVTALFGQLFTQRNLQKDRLRITVNGRQAWSEFTWTFDATRTDGTPHHTRGRETQIFTKEDDGQWRLVHIHYSSAK